MREVYERREKRGRVAGLEIRGMSSCLYQIQRSNIYDFFNCCPDYIREMLERAGFTARIGTEHLFVSVHDAVIHAVGIHSEVSIN